MNEAEEYEYRVNSKEWILLKFFFLFGLSYLMGTLLIYMAADYCKQQKLLHNMATTTTVATNSTSDGTHNATFTSTADPHTQWNGGAVEGPDNNRNSTTSSHITSLLHNTTAVHLSNHGTDSAQLRYDPATHARDEGDKNGSPAAAVDSSSAVVTLTYDTQHHDRINHDTEHLKRWGVSMELQSDANSEGTDNKERWTVVMYSHSMYNNGTVQ